MPRNPEHYSHRRNTDETYDSICMRCFATISTQKTKALLARAEEEHLCHPLQRAASDNQSKFTGLASGMTTRKAKANTRMTAFG